MNDLIHDDNGEYNFGDLDLSDETAVGDYDFADLIDAMKKDKKNDDDLISFMLPKQLGDCVEIKIGPKELLPILENVRKMI